MTDYPAPPSPRNAESMPLAQAYMLCESRIRDWQTILLYVFAGLVALFIATATAISDQKTPLAIVFAIVMLSLAGYALPRIWREVRATRHKADALHRRFANRGEVLQLDELMYFRPTLGDPRRAIADE